MPGVDSTIDEMPFELLFRRQYSERVKAEISRKILAVIRSSFVSMNVHGQPNLDGFVILGLGPMDEAVFAYVVFGGRIEAHEMPNRETANRFLELMEKHNGTTTLSSVSYSFFERN